MGYTTDFNGRFELDKPLAEAHAAYLHLFSGTRRMKRKSSFAKTLPDPVREAAKLSIGDEGAYFVGGGGDYGQANDESVVDHNRPPDGQPGLWCQWIPSEDLEAIEWDESEKFYNYEEWIVYLIEHFLKPWGYVLNGSVKWQGEDFDDRGIMTIKDNEFSSHSLE